MESNGLLNERKLFRRKERTADPNEDRTPNLKFFFKQFGRKFWQIITLNLMMIFRILPIIVAVIVYFNGPQTPTQTYTTYAPLLGMQTAAGTPETATLLNSALMQLGLPTFHSYVYWVMIPLIIITVLTYGWQNVGATYVLRRLVNGEGTFIWSDYFHAVRKNFRQGLILGIIDSIAIFILAFDVIYFWNQAEASFLNNLMFGMTVGITIIYLVMRMYTYLQLVTFKISIFKLLKNAMIFTALGIKRNFMALLGCLVLIGIYVLLVILLVPIKLYAVLILPLLCFMGFIGFISTYAAYPVIDKYMIQPSK